MGERWNEKLDMKREEKMENSAKNWKTWKT
jgi:hypothetical protein